MHTVDSRFSARQTFRHALLAGVMGAATLAASAASAASAATVGDGLRLNGDSAAWPQWQTRLSIGAQPLGPAPNMLDSRLSLGASLAGDRYFDIGRIGDGGGLRATGALLFGSPSVALGAPGAYGSGSLLMSRATFGGSSQASESALDTTATPYLGMGYTAWWARSGLGLSADLGLLATRNAGGSRRLLSGNPNSGLDDPSRPYQLAPVLQVQLSYSF
ncbi:hypothetical protein LRH25_04040 [Ideonella azotifigens]|uniref:Uncharacterized protein n=1 Tax=Ideonella azotifigens TaxID=513160 RepID=A0ABP3VSA2_9BURK|nr:hypothetical protein [Ideonella azotifigens]MCD2339507.1 hypothetical protein [Ideonella azotifigens]